MWEPSSVDQKTEFGRKETRMETEATTARTADGRPGLWLMADGRVSTCFPACVHGRRAGRHLKQKTAIEGRSQYGRWEKGQQYI